MFDPSRIKAPLEMEQFVSSNLKAGLYDFGVQDLYIRFHGDRIYIYQFVPAKVWNELVNASSHGSYHYHSIRMTFPYEELTTSDFPQQGRAYGEHSDKFEKLLR